MESGLRKPLSIVYSELNICQSVRKNSFYETECNLRMLKVRAQLVSQNLSAPPSTERYFS